MTKLRRISPLAAALALALAGTAHAAANLPDNCLGERQPLTVASQMPYALVGLGGRQGYMVLDFGATLSSVTPQAFQGPVKPAPVAGSSGVAGPGQASAFDDFVFFGPWGRVQMLLQPQAPVAPARTADGQAAVPQAGVLGTDFLAQHVYTLDYRGGHLWRAAAGQFCSDAALRGAGFRALSTRHYYGPQPGALSCPGAGAPPGGCVNIPSLPLRMGAVTAVAQLDTGYDDRHQPYSININQALFDALRAAGVGLVPQPAIAVQLSTCQPGVVERLEAYRLKPGTVFGLVDDSGRLLPAPPRPVTLMLKRTPPAAAVCGGIGTWARPAAQLGASFVARGQLVVDPFSARVWLR